MHFKRTLLSTLAVAVLATGPSFVSITAHASDSASRPVAPVNLSRIRIDNFGQINATYYRGEQPDGGDYADLAAIGIKTVIDLQADGDSGEQRFVEAAGMKFHRIPMTTHVPPTQQQLAKFLEIVNDPAQQPGPHRVVGRRIGEAARRRDVSRPCALPPRIGRLGRTSRRLASWKAEAYSSRAPRNRILAGKSLPPFGT